MSKVDCIVSLLVINLGSVLCQTARTTTTRVLPQWLTGIIAVVGFLFLTFVVFLIKRAWCEKPKRNILDLESTKENHYASVKKNGSTMNRRNSAELKTYINLAMDPSEEKVTTM